MIQGILTTEGEWFVIETASILQLRSVVSLGFVGIVNGVTEIRQTETGFELRRSTERSFSSVPFAKVAMTLKPLDEDRPKRGERWHINVSYGAKQ